MLFRYSLYRTIHPINHLHPPGVQIAFSESMKVRIGPTHSSLNNFMKINDVVFRYWDISPAKNLKSTN